MSVANGLVTVGNTVDNVYDSLTNNGVADFIYTGPKQVYLTRNCTQTATTANSTGTYFVSNAFSYFSGTLSYGTGIVFSAGLMDASFTPDGKIVATDSQVGAIKLADLQQKTFISTLGQISNNNADTGDGGLASNARISHPRGIVVDRYGNQYISSETGYIRKIDVNGIISTVAGKALGDGGVYATEAPATNMNFNKPYGLAVDNDRNYLYVADTGYNRVVRIDLISGIATTIAGTGDCGIGSLGDGGAALSSQICQPTMLGLDSSGNLLIHDQGNKRIRKVTFNSNVGNTLVFAPTNKDNSTLVRNSDGTWTRTYRDGTKAYFTADGLNYASVDKLGMQTSYEYNADGNLTKISYPNGQYLLVTYSGNLMSSLQDPAGRTTTFNYSGGMLTRVNYPDGTGVSYEYDSNGIMTKEINQRGLSRKFAYNEWNRLTDITEADNSITHVSDSTSQSLSKSSSGTLESSGVTGNNIRDIVENAKEVTTEFSKDHNGLITIAKNAKGEITQILRDLDGYPTQIIYPDESSQTYVYDPNTRDVLSVTDDDTGVTISKTYDSNGHILTKTDGNGKIISYIYDSSSGLLLSENYPGGLSNQYSYYSNGLLKSKTISSNSNSLTTSYEYDIYGNKTKVTSADGKVTTFVNDPVGNPIEIRSQIQGGREALVKYDYDLWGRVLKVTSPNGEVTQYNYSQTGQLQQIIDANNKVITHEYDNLDRIVKKTDSLGNVSSTTYDLLGNVSSETDPRGNTKIYSYDELNRVIQVSLPDDVFNYTYNNRGEVIYAKNSISEMSYIKDSNGRPIQSRVSGIGAMANYPAITLSFAYDNNGNRLSVQSELGAVQYAYDVLDRVTQISNFSGKVFNYGYDGANRLAYITRPGSRTDYSFSGAGQILSIIHSSSGNTKDFVQYEYDGREFPNLRRSPAGNLSYGYDLNGQVTSGDGVSSESFGYDNMGNRISDTHGTYTYDSNKQRLTEDWQYNYSYDNNGNLIQKISKVQGNKTYLYSYSSTNQLTQVRILDQPLGAVNKQIDFVYDLNGHRIQKSVWDKDNQSDPKKTYVRKYIYDGDSILAEYDGNNGLLVKYTHGLVMMDDVVEADVSVSGVAAGLSDQSTKYYFVKDALGSTTAVLDDGGNVVQRYSYSIFGKIDQITNEAGADITSNPKVNFSYTYTGREWDSETDLYYYRARYYDPSIGRFIQADPEPGSLNMPITVVNKYVYANNHPTNMIDPNGRFGFLIAIGIAALFSAAVSAIEAHFQTGDYHQNFWNNFAINFGVSLIGIVFTEVASLIKFSKGAEFSLGWMGVYSEAPVGVGGRGFSIGFFQDTSGQGINTQTYWHEVGHSFNFLLFTAGQTGRIEDRFWRAVGFYGLHLAGSLGDLGKWNPITWITEGGADLWSSPKYKFRELGDYTKLW